MSLATRCTQCGTIFRVVQDQLKVYEGWVRCGRCNEVFNALEGLFDLDHDPPPQRVLPASEPPVAVEPPPSVPAPSPAEPLAAPPAEAQPPSPHGSAPFGAMEFVASREGDNDPDPAAAMPQTYEEDALESRFLVKRDAGARAPQRGDHPEFEDARFPEQMTGDSSLDAAADEASPAPERARRKPLMQRWRDSRRMRAQQREEQRAAAKPDLRDMRDMRDMRDVHDVRDQGEAPEQRDPRELHEVDEVSTQIQSTQIEDSALESQDVGFIRDAERAERRRRPAARAGMALLAMCLVAALAVQVALQFHDGIAASHPQTRPALEALCDFAGCTLEAPRHIDDWMIESTALAKVEGAEAYRFSLTLRNRGPVTLQLPSVDLSVSDAAGELIARRALSPAELRAASSTVAAGGEANLQVVLSAGSRRITGYAAEVFYP